MKLVFASCMDASRDATQAIWDHIREHERPDALALLGDQIYMDWGDLGPPNLPRQLAVGTLTLAQFARNMHRRYAAQWAVPSFRRLVCGLPLRDQPGRLIVCWDDHDFAWNNSLGAGQPAHPNAVPAEVKSVSRRLFDQFVRQLRTGAEDAPYPGLPADVMSPWIGPGVGEAGPLAGSTHRYRLLDNRWNRSERRANGTGHLLEDEVRAALLAEVARPDGLLVLLGGTPMAHDHLFSEQSWHASDEGDYLEYPALLSAARRPVLYLAGDVHHNAWGGRLLLPGSAQPSQVVQVLSSGAALDQLIPGVPVEPSYGVVELPDAPEAGQARIGLWERREDGWQPSLSVPLLPYDQHGWVGDLQGEAATIDDGPPDTSALSALVCRPRTAHCGNTQSLPVADLKDLNPVYRAEGWPPDGAWPEPLLLHPPAGPTRLAQAMCRLDQGDLRPQEMADLMAACYARAQDRGAQSVVFYIHGFGKHMGAALAQAYALRRQDEAVEPIAFCWQAGERHGLFDALGAVGMAKRGAEASAWALRRSLEGLAHVARDHPEQTTVVLARSAGALLLHHALHSNEFDPNERFRGIARVVLSAPLLDHRRLLKASGLNQALGRWQLPQFIVSNRNDRTLRRARWLFDEHDQRQIAGLWPPAQALPPRVAWLDHSDCPGTGALHDHLFVQLGEHARTVRHALLCAPHVDLPALASAGHLSPSTPGTWHVQ